MKQALSSPILLSSLGTPESKKTPCILLLGNGVITFLESFRKLLFGAVEGLHSTGLRSSHFVNNLSPVVCVMGRTKSYVDSAILSSIQLTGTPAECCLRKPREASPLADSLTKT